MPKDTAASSAPASGSAPAAGHAAKVLSDDPTQECIMTVEIKGLWQCQIPADEVDIAAFIQTSKGRLAMLPALTQVHNPPLHSIVLQLNWEKDNQKVVFHLVAQ